MNDLDVLDGRASYRPDALRAWVDFQTRMWSWVVA